MSEDSSSSGSIVTQFFAWISAGTNFESAYLLLILAIQNFGLISMEISVADVNVYVDKCNFGYVNLNGSEAAAAAVLLKRSTRRDFVELKRLQPPLGIVL